MSLTKTEQGVLVKLLEKIEWPLPYSVFHMLVQRVITVCIEVMILDENDQVLLIYRNDHEYKGYHIPGTVLRDNETVSEGLRRLFLEEVPGIEIEAPKDHGWFETGKGNNEDQNPTRHTISLLYTCRLKKPYTLEGGIFFSTSTLPENILSYHKMLIDVFNKRRHEGKGE